MKWALSTAAAVWLLMGLLCGGASAGQYPHARDGWVYGLYAGWGWTGLSATDISQDQPLERESNIANDITGGIRLGYCPTANFSYGIDIAGWKGDKGWSDESESDDFETVVYWVLVQGHWYPRGQGFYLRGGIGLGSVGVKFDGPGGTVSETTSGLGWNAGVGYEWRLSPRFALGAQYDYRGADVGKLDTYYDDVATRTQSLTATLTWYAQ